MKTVHVLCLALFLSIGAGSGTQNCQGGQCDQNNGGGGPLCRKETRKKCSQKDGTGTPSMECVEVEENVCQVCTTQHQEECKMVEEPTQIQTVETVCQARLVCTFLIDIMAAVSILFGVSATKISSFDFNRPLPI